MGASEFGTKSKGKTVAEAFRTAVEEAQYLHGHGGYTGTVAEKDGFKVFSVPEETTLERFLELISNFDDLDDSLPPGARKTIEQARKVYDDKWGPAVAVKVAPDEWLFCGLASS